MKSKIWNGRSSWKTLSGAVAMAASLALSGCGLGLAAGDPVNTFGAEATMRGTVHGGQQPVAFATVQLYAAGTSGYGSAGTLLATTTTSDPDGLFTFVKSDTNGSSSGTGNTWACPATTDDPQLYLLTTGGNSIGNHLSDMANTNTAITMVAALGPCSTVTNSMFVIVNEVSTAAAAFALAPYIHAGTSAGTETIGTNGANVPTSTPQAAIGLNNAVAGIANLESTSMSYSGTSASTSSITITATPEENKINTIADILASCVNTQTLPSATCTQLFNAALSTDGTKPVDIFQAAYFMATNPTNAGTFTACGAPTTNLGCLFALTSSTSPFQGTLSAQPTDWTVGITYTVSNSGTCQNNGFGGAKFFDTPTRTAVDANGNIFIMNGSASKAAIVEMSPIGVPLACVVPAVQSATTAQTYGQNLTIDPSGNVWGAYSHATFTNSIVEWPSGTTSAITYSPAAQVYGITADMDGNVFYTTSGNGGTVYEFVAPTSGTLNLSTATPITAFSGFLKGSTGTVQLNNLQTDSLGRLFGISASTSNLLSAYPLNAPITAYSVSGNTVTFTASNSFSAGQTVTISGLSTGTQFNGQRMTVSSANSTSFTASFTTADITTTADSGMARATGAGAYTTANTGLTSASYGLAIGASNSIYTGTACCGNTSTAVGKAEKFTPASTAAAGTGAASAQYLGGMNGTRAVAVDGAGMVWLGEYWPETSGGVYGLAELSETGSGTGVTFSAVSPTGTAPSAACSNSVGCLVNGGFQKTGFKATMDVAVDPSGNVWVLNTGTNTSGTIGTNGSSITEVVGAATPVATPLSAAAKNGTLGSRP